MSATTVRFNVRLAVQDGKLDAFEAVVRQMTTATMKEPGTLAYEFYLSGDRKECHFG
jgi:quinol monooxygenase YgiN